MFIQLHIKSNTYLFSFPLKSPLDYTISIYMVNIKGVTKNNEYTQLFYSII